MSSTFQRGNVFASRNMAEATRGSLRLYRRALKAAPTMVRTYRLPLEVAEIRRRIRYDFESHSHVTDPAIVDLLVMKGENNLEEVEQNWATKAHVMHYLLDVQAKHEAAKYNAETSDDAKFLAELLDGTPGSMESWKKFA